MRILERDARTGADDAFVQLPHALYAGDPCWIPDEEHVLRASFSAANDWFARGCALALCVPGRARLAVFRAPDCRVDGRPAAFFGYFEAGDDAVAAGALLERASEWARAAGAEVLYGPVDFDTLGRYRLRTAVEPGGGLPFPGEPYGRPCATETYRNCRSGEIAIPCGPLMSVGINPTRTSWSIFAMPPPSAPGLNRTRTILSADSHTTYTK